MLKLGSEVKDLSSGVVGMLGHHVASLGGMIQYILQPLSTDGSLKEVVAADLNVVELVGPGISDKCIEPKPEALAIELGSKVEDLVTGFTGVAVSRAVYINGCTRYCVQGRVKEEGKEPVELWVDPQRLKVVDSKLVALLDRSKEAIKEVVAGGRARGGPRHKPGRML